MGAMPCILWPLTGAAPTGALPPPPLPPPPPPPLPPLAGCLVAATDMGAGRMSGSGFTFTDAIVGF